MISKCDGTFKNELGKFDSNDIEVKWFNCVNEAEKWQKEHLP
jgi:hypothetical protein